MGSGEGNIHPGGAGGSIRGGLNEDFVLNDDKLGQGTTGQRRAANMSAIRLVKQLQKENRKTTTKAEVIMLRWHHKPLK
jgi:hypothetical protein